jgi:predicted dehydrogenase
VTARAEARAAIIGAGLMGQWHADAVRRIGGRVTVIVEPNETTRTAVGQRHPGAWLMPELDANAIAEHASVAHVCSPLATHATIARSLIEAGIHALVEKPFTPTADQAAVLLDLATARNVALCPVHQFLFQDGVRQVVDWLPELGIIRRVEFSACSAGAKAADRASLDDLIGEILPHPLSLVSSLLDADVARLDWHVVHPAPGEFRGVASSGKAVVDVAISANGRPTENTLRVVADGGTASADLFHGYATRSSPAVSRRAKVIYPFAAAGRSLQAASLNLARRAMRHEPAYPGLRRLVRAFYNAVATGAPTPIAPRVILEVARARDLLLERIRELS